MNDLKNIILNSELVEYEDISDSSIIMNLIKIYNYNVVIYGGAGISGMFAIKFLKRENIIPSYIIDSDVSKSGTKLEGIEVISTSEIKNKIHNTDNVYVIIVTSFFESLEQDKITKILYENNLKKYFYLKNNENAKSNWMSYYSNHINDIYKFYNILEDDESKDALFEYIRVVMQNDIYRLPHHMSKYKYWGCNDDEKDDVYRHISNENWINCGSAAGDTIYRFLERGYSFDNIFAFEGNKHMCDLLKVNIKLLPDKLNKKIVLFNEFLGNDSGDFNFNSYFEHIKISLINMDIEGAELSVLKATKDLICKCKPVLAICLYHRKEDIVEIPKFIKNCSDDYHFFIRKYSHNCGSISFSKDELVLYAVPSNRLV